MALQVQNQSAQTNSILNAITYSEGTKFDSVQCYFQTKHTIMLKSSDSYKTDPNTSSIFLHIQSTQNKLKAIELSTIHNGYRTALKESIIQTTKEILVLFKPILDHAQQLALIIAPNPIQKCFQPLPHWNYRFTHGKI